MPPFPPRDLLRASVGAFVGLSLCALMVATVGPQVGLSWALIAPLGASAVLLFAVPNSPLAQPWSAVVGNVVSAFAALGALTFVPAPWTVGVAVGGAILAMMLVRALHPPGGAVALLSVLDPGPVLDAGIWFVVLPVGLDTAVLVIAAIAYNRLLGRVYPFRQADAPESVEAALRLGLSNDELGALLLRFHQSTNMGVADLGRLLAAAEQEAVQHRFDSTTCGDVMTSGLITARPETPLATLVDLFREHRIKSVPVVDATGACAGVVLQADVLAPLMAQGPVGVLRRKRAAPLASSLMRPVATLPQDLPVGQLLNRLAVQGAEVVPVTSDGRLVGVLTRSDIMRLLLHGSDERRVA